MGPFDNIRRKNAFPKICRNWKNRCPHRCACAGKIAAIVDVIDQNRVLVDGPCSGVERHEEKIKNLHLTPIKMTFPFSARTRVVRKAWEAEKVAEKWGQSSWAKRMAMKSKRQGLNDFDRFKLMKAKSARNKIVAKAVAIKKNKMSKAGKL